jgi:cytochrome c oxidase subunit 2
MDRGNRLSIYLYEFAWILPSIAIPVAMLVAIALSAFAVGINVQGVYGRIDPTRVDATPPFDRPGLRQIGPNRYEAVIVAEVWRWVAASPDDKSKRVELTIPRGSELTFVVTSRDVLHGFKVQNSTINMMVIPGQISRATARFDVPGEYLFVCHEYCGTGHHFMYGVLRVE